MASALAVALRKSLSPFELHLSHLSILKASQHFIQREVEVGESAVSQTCLRI